LIEAGSEEKAFFAKRTYPLRAKIRRISSAQGEQKAFFAKRNLFGMVFGQRTQIGGRRKTCKNEPTRAKRCSGLSRIVRILRHEPYGGLDEANVSYSIFHLFGPLGHPCG
jgi:hypothetical protein